MSNDATKDVEQLSLKFEPSSDAVVAENKIVGRGIISPFVDAKILEIRREAIERVKKSGIFQHC